MTTTPLLKRTINGKGWKFDKRAYRAEVSRLASLANKRIQRLEKADLTSSPAYQRWVEDGKVRFSVRGKTFNEVQAEMSKINRFVDAKTSTIRGLNSTLKDMANNIGIEYKDMAELRNKAEKFFELSNKVEEYLRNVEDIASAIGYHEIWEVINTYTEDEDIKLEAADADIDGMVKIVSDLIVKMPNKQVHDFDTTDGFVFIT